eukprot:scaffold652320_cov48-Prasinocladus_malaysianus.AAC.1
MATRGLRRRSSIASWMRPTATSSRGWQLGVESPRLRRSAWPRGGCTAGRMQRLLAWWTNWEAS